MFKNTRLRLRIHFARSLITIATEAQITKPNSNRCSAAILQHFQFNMQNYHSMKFTSTSKAKITTLIYADNPVSTGAINVTVVIKSIAITMSTCHEHFHHDANCHCSLSRNDNIGKRTRFKYRFTPLRDTDDSFTCTLKMRTVFVIYRYRKTTLENLTPAQFDKNTT